MSNKQFSVSLLVNAKCGGGRRPARRKISHGAIFCVNNPVITYFCLLSISDGALGRKRRGKCWWSDGRDRYEYFIVLNEIFAYAYIEIFRWALCSCKRVRLADFLRKFAERIFPLWPTDSCKRGRSTRTRHHHVHSSEKQHTYLYDITQLLKYIQYKHTSQNLM